jgi:hypothetical protein
MQQEFNQSRRLAKDEKEQKFYELEELADAKANMNPTSVEEEKVKMDEDEALVEQCVFNQIFFRYCHELNKVYFFIFSTKKIQSY